MCVRLSLFSLLPVVIVVYHLSLKARAPHKSTQIAFESYYLCLVPTVKYQKIQKKVDGRRRRREEAKTKAYCADPKILKHSLRGGRGAGRKSLCTFLWHFLCCSLLLLLSPFCCSFLSCAVLFWLQQLPATTFPFSQKSFAVCCVTQFWSVFAFPPSPFQPYSFMSWQKVKIPLLVWYLDFVVAFLC